MCLSSVDTALANDIEVYAGYLESLETQNAQGTSKIEKCFDQSDKLDNEVQKYSIEQQKFKAILNEIGVLETRVEFLEKIAHEISGAVSRVV